jgi:hypothetical protein
MEQFDSTVFMHEIEWLIPENRIGSYYSGNHDHAEGGHNSEVKSGLAGEAAAK